MKVTVITLYLDKEASHLVAVVEGEVSHEDFEKLAKELRATPDLYGHADVGGEPRQLFKIEVDTYPTAGAVKSVNALY